MDMKYNESFRESNAFLQVASTRDSCDFL
jgi:hypothetical protein